MSTLGIIIWSIALGALLFHVVGLTLSEPKGERLPLCTYWLLFILSPLVIFAFIVSFAPMALILGFVLLVILAMIGERGIRVWGRLFTRSL